MATAEIAAAVDAAVTFAWSYRAGDYVRGRPAAAGDWVFVGADDNRLHALGPEIIENRT